MTETIKKTTNELTYNAYFREKCFFVLAPLCGVFFLGYLYFLGANLANVLTRSHTLAHIHELKKDNATLESKYLALLEGLSLESAKAYGLLEAKEVYFAKETTFAVANEKLSHDFR